MEVVTHQCALSPILSNNHNNTKKRKFRKKGKICNYDWIYCKDNDGDLLFGGDHRVVYELFVVLNNVPMKATVQVGKITTIFAVFEVASIFYELLWPKEAFLEQNSPGCGYFFWSQLFGDCHYQVKMKKSCSDFRINIEMNFDAFALTFSFSYCLSKWIHHTTDGLATNISQQL